VGNVIKSLKCCLIFCLLFSSNVYAYNDDDTKTLPTVQPSVPLSPQMRSQTLDSAKYTFLATDLQHYLDNMIVFDSVDAYESQPRILGFVLDSSYGSAGDFAYATGLLSGDNISAYTILKQGQNYKDPGTGDFLGIQAFVVGDAEVQTYNNPQTIKITKATDHIQIGDRLIQRTGLDLPAIIEAKPAAQNLTGYILSVKNPKTGVGKHSTIVVSLGSRNGLQFGDLLNLKEAPKTLVDPITKEKSIVQSTSFGEVLIYKVMEKVSLGFIVNTTRPVLVKDQVSSSS
jgi:hypothetical protein